MICLCLLACLLNIDSEINMFKPNSLSKINDDCFKNLTARVLTRFLANLGR